MGNAKSVRTAVPLFLGFTAPEALWVLGSNDPPPAGDRDGLLVPANLGGAPLGQRTAWTPSSLYQDRYGVAGFATGADPKT